MLLSSEGLSLAPPDPADQEAVKAFCRQLAAAERELTDRYIDTVRVAKVQAKLRTKRCLGTREIE